MNNCIGGVLHAFVLQYGAKRRKMGVNISIKNVPQDKLERLKARAKQNHRSLQGELLALIDEAIKAEPEQRKTITIDELVENGKRLGLTTADEATQWIRHDRDSR
jgi:antitoxin FitA